MSARTAGTSWDVLVSTVCAYSVLLSSGVAGTIGGRSQRATGGMGSSRATGAKVGASRVDKADGTMAGAGPVGVRE